MFGTLASLIVIAALLQGFVSAAPTIAPTIERRSVSSLTPSQVSSLVPYTQFARAAYCSGTSNWQCGAACDALPGFQPTLTGGDGNDVQLYFIGYWPTQNTVVVGHEGTDPTQLLSDLTDADILMGTLDTTLFPGASSSAQVHEGFRNEHAQTASDVLAETQRLISLHGATTVTLVGHSLGGALAELDALMLSLHLPSNIGIVARTFGTPRVGNSNYASFFDAHVSNFMRINNQYDIVPIVPGRFLGFSHVQGETHLLSTSNAVSCPGNDDATDRQCQIQTVPNVLEGDILNHLGPYVNNIYIGTIYC